jgi:septal ring factor EnvC (AmiA/AmiB activator)
MYIVRLCMSTLSIILICPLVDAAPPKKSNAHRSRSTQRKTHHEHARLDRTPISSKRSKQERKLFKLDREILGLTLRQRELQATLIATKVKRDNITKDLLALEEQLTLRREAVTRALVIRRRLHSARVAEVFISADGPLDLKRREVYLEALFKSDLGALLALKSDQDLAQKHRVELRELEEKTQRYQQRLGEQTERLLSTRREELSLITKRGESQLSDRQGARRLPPTLGKWRDQFRSFRGVESSRLYGGGVSIEGALGAPVYATERGVVAFAGRVRGWGGVVILSHPKKLLSIYGNVFEVKVRSGQEVKTQQHIGTVGDSHGTPSLYFEVRLHGYPIHPKRWAEPRPLIIQ